MTPRPRSRRRLLEVAPALALLSCGPSYSLRGFDVNYPDSRAAALEALSRSLSGGERSAPDVALVALVPPSPAHGFRVFELPSGRALWGTDTPIDSRPVFTPTLVLAHAGSQTLAWDRSTGAERFRIADGGLPLLAAHGDARHVALTFSAGGLGQRSTAVRVVDASSGSTVFSREVEHSVGTAAVLHGHLLLPWSGQYLSVFDLRTDAEVARVRSTDDVFSRVWTDDGAAFFGTRAIYRVDESLAGGTRPSGTGSLVVTRADLPGSPPIMADGYARTHAGLDARERVRLAVRPDPALPGVQPAGGAVYALYHRIVFALERAALADDGTAPRWAYTHEADLAGAEPVRAGLLLADEAGQVVFVDGATGVAGFRVDLRAPAAQAIFSAPLGFRPAHAAALDVRDVPAARGLLAAVGGTDTRLLPARVFAVRALVRTPGTEATRALLDVAARRTYPPEIVAAAREAIAARTEAPEVFLRALEAHQDWVRGTPGPAVGPLARALSAANERRAVPLLAAQLQDPATTAVDLTPLTAALDTLGDPAAVPALLDFLRLYHADEGPLADAEGRPVRDDRTIAEVESVITALSTAARTVARLGGPSERRWLSVLAADANTMRALREPLTRAASMRAGEGAGAPGASAAPSTPTTAPEGPPPRATRELIELGFAPVRAAMLQCVNALESRPASVRLTFHYNGDGSLNAVAVAPPSLNDCVLPLARSVRLPPTQVRTDTGSYYLVGGARH